MVLRCRVPCLLSAFLLCSRCVACKYGSISHFKGIFSGFYGVRVGLCCLGALRGSCGFCVREWLGGYMTCGVFASILSLCSCFSSFVLLSWLASPWLPALLALLLFWLCGLVSLLGWVVGFLSLSDGFRHKKKGRNSLRPLLSCCELV